MSLRKQTLINSLGSLTLLGCQWLISILLVRVSGYEDAGVFALAMSIANVFATLANYGMRNFQVADVGGKYAPNQFVAARGVLSCVALLLCVLYVLLDGYSKRNALAICLYLSYSLSFILSDILMGNLQMAGHLEINGYSNSLRGMLSFLLFMAFLLLTGNLLYALAAMSMGSLLILVFFDCPLYFRVCRERGKREDLRLRCVLGIVRDCFFVFVAAVIPIVITAIPRREIQRQMGEAMLGIFSSIYTPMVILNTLIPSLLLALIPGIARLWEEKDKKGLRKSVWKCFGIVIAVTLAAAAFAVFAGKLFLQILYGADILPYAPLFVYSVAAIGLNCACICGGYILIAFQASGLVAVLSGLSVAAAFAVSGALIRQYGIYGGAFVLIVAYGVLIMLQLCAIEAKMKKRWKK